MNTRKLNSMGVPHDCIKNAIAVIQAVAKYNRTVPKQSRLDDENILQECIEKPDYFYTQGGEEKADFQNKYGSIAHSLVALGENLIKDRDFKRPDPISYKTWGADGIDAASHAQMKVACGLPSAVGAALMPDAHVGYGLPIGGVLALENAVCPYAVGVDIACRMKLSLFDMPVETLDTKFEIYKNALEKGTKFGRGAIHDQIQNHAVMDQDWSVTRITRERKDVAWKQLGSSGSGNHFVEFGIVTLQTDNDLNVPAGKYVAIMSHSGSRNPGHAVCNTYSNIARTKLPRKFEDLGQLAWLGLDTEEGQAYWAAMNLMGDYAAANHDVIHRVVSKLVGAKIIAGVENHHNFAWKEIHNGKEVIVHRKGATPAGVGVLGVIPGSMEHPAFIVKGKGNPESLCSASHGAGRQMSRTKGKEKYSKKAVQNDLAKKGIVVLGFGSDESPGVYKDIETVMAQQTDLVEIIGKFHPKIVMMDDSGSEAED